MSRFESKADKDTNHGLWGKNEDFGDCLEAGG